jgi:helicase
MLLDETAVDKTVINVFQEQGITELYPPQEEALPYALQGKNIVLSVPTAGGKSLVAYLAIAHRLLREKGKALYVVPLRALAREKYEDLKWFEQLGLRVGISTGDLHDSNPRLGRYDIIVCTSEKADSLLRHGIRWRDKIKVLVVDEIHLIHDPSRGPTLEVIVARFKALNPGTQIIALSATIANAVDLSLWLDAQLVCSEWRPVVLKEGVCYRNEITFTDGSKRVVAGPVSKSLEVLVEESVVDGGQILIFVNNRLSTVSLAMVLAERMVEHLSQQERTGLKKIGTAMKRAQVERSAFGQKLRACIGQGVAFHHAGLSTVQRRAVEQGFKDRLIKCIVATPTLAAGVNIPARRVIIRDLWRYDSGFGMHPIPILEYKQQAGRAGRPQYDTEGEAITIAKNPEQRDRIFENYLLADTEPIYSKLGSQSALRMHLLSAIATRFVETDESIYQFAENTFYAYQSDIGTLRDEIDTAVQFLLEYGFIESIDNRYTATLFGSRTSSLYIDPLSAVQLRTALEHTKDKPLSSVSYLHAICSTPDIRSLYLRSTDTWIEEKAERLKGTLILEPPSLSSQDYEWFLSDLKTALLLEDWISELSEDRLISKYNIGPGDIYSLVETAEWLLHATQEFTRMYNFSLVPDVSDLIVRVHNGCKKELLNLISLRGIGRVRARALYTEGFKTVHELRGVPLERLAQIKTIGTTIARSIKNQIGEGQKMGYTELRKFYPR